MTNDLTYIWDLIIDYNIATYEELKLITGINGFSIETLNDVIYYKTGYRDIEQYQDYAGLNNDWQSIQDLFYMSLY